MPKTWTDDGNYAQNLDYRATARRAREEKEMERARPAKKRKAKPINPNSLPTGKRDVHKLPRAARPKRGKSYPTHGAKRGGGRALAR